MNPLPIADLNEFFANHDAEFIKYALGATPLSLATTLRDTLGNMASVDRRSFGILCVLSAFTARRLLNELLMRPDMEEVNKYITAHWSVKSTPNFTSLNLMGNIIVAAHVSPGPPLVESYRTKLGGRSLWDIDIRKSRLSEQAKTISIEKVTRISREDAINYGTAVIVLLVHGPRGLPGPNLPRNLRGFNAGDFFAAPGVRRANATGAAIHISEGQGAGTEAGEHVVHDRMSGNRSEGGVNPDLRGEDLGARDSRNVPVDDPNRRGKRAHEASTSQAEDSRASVRRSTRLNKGRDK